MQLDLPHISPSDTVKTFDEERGTRTVVHRAPIFLAAPLHVVPVSTVDAQTVCVACGKFISLMQRCISSLRGPCSEQDLHHQSLPNVPFNVHVNFPQSVLVFLPGQFECSLILLLS